ncbi:MAG: hypothetical protein WBA65_08260 [Rhodanobacter sp.]
MLRTPHRQVLKLTRISSAVALMLASPAAAASYLDGFGTVVILGTAVIASAAAFILALVMCAFRLFRSAVVLSVFASLASLAATVVALLVWEDSKAGGIRGAAMSMIVILLILVTAPGLIQHLIHRRRLKQDASRRNAGGQELTFQEIIDHERECNP